MSMYLLNITIRQEKNLKYWGSRYIFSDILCNLRSVLQLAKLNKLLLGQNAGYISIKTEREFFAFRMMILHKKAPLSYKNHFSKVSQENKIETFCHCFRLKSFDLRFSSEGCKKELSQCNNVIFISHFKMVSSIKCRILG